MLHLSTPKGFKRLLKISFLMHSNPKYILVHRMIGMLNKNTLQLSSL